MILWLASYPRAGNTLCRLVMHQCFGLGSCSDQGNGSERSIIGLGAERGLLQFEGEWEAFYEQASADRSLHLVKTHLPPRDAQPAIVVMRDPRSTLCSYYHYLRQHLIHYPITLQDIVKGDVFYGDLIEFYRRWMGRPAGCSLLVRYEELVDLSAVTINRLAAFAGIEPTEIQPVGFDGLRAARPSFFRSGSTSWSGDPEWTEEVEEVFRERFAPEVRRFGQL